MPKIPDPELVLELEPEPAAEDVLRPEDGDGDGDEDEAAPARLTSVYLFLCTYAARLEGLALPELADGMNGHRFLSRRLRPHGQLVAFNSTFGSGALPGYESYIKVPKVPDVEPQGPGMPGRRRRPPQGLGTCFNSAIEPIIIPEAFPDRVFKLKFFPATGQVQVPDTKRQDYADGMAAIRAFVHELERQGFGAFAVRDAQPFMLNYKSTIVRRQGAPDPRRDIVDLVALQRAIAGHAHAPPFPVEGTGRALEENGYVKDNRLLFWCKYAPGCEKKKITIKIYLGGKINLLGARSPEQARRIFGWLRRICARTRLVERIPLPTSGPKRAGRGAKKAPPAERAAPAGALPPEDEAEQYSDLLEDLLGASSSEASEDETPRGDAALALQGLRLGDPPPAAVGGEDGEPARAAPTFAQREREEPRQPPPGPAKAYSSPWSRAAPAAM